MLLCPLAMFCHVCVDAVDNNDCNATSVCDDEHVRSLLMVPSSQKHLK